MPPHGHCRVCGAPAPGNMPCYRCIGLLLQRDNESLEWELRVVASEELVKLHDAYTKRKINNE